jgi:hypothetical protein
VPRIKREYKTTHTRSDRAGNMLLVKEEPVYGTRKFYLHLVAEKHARLIGEVDRQNKIMFMKRDSAKHYHFQMRAYGFNYVVLKESQQFDRILLQIKLLDDYYEYYLIPKSFIMEYGQVKEFNKTGFEIQIFLRAEYLERFKTKQRFERSKLVDVE